MFIQLFLIVTFISLQACSKTRIGEELEKSFDSIDNTKISKTTPNIKEQKKLTKLKKVKSSNYYNKDNENVQINITKPYSVSNEDKSIQKPTKSRKKVIFKPQPYRIILKLSGANPSAPAETVTKALRKAGVEFEVEKIERFDQRSLLNDSSLKRKEF